MKNKVLCTYKVKPDFNRDDLINKLSNELRYGVLINKEDDIQISEIPVVEGEPLEIEVNEVDENTISVIFDVDKLLDTLEYLPLFIWVKGFMNLVEDFPIKLEDIEMPEFLIRRLIGSSRNVHLNSKFFFGMILKPYSIIKSSEKWKTIEKMVELGVNFIKDDETAFNSLQTISKFNNFVVEISKRINQTIYYIPNITHLITNSEKIDILYKHGVKIGLVTYITVGMLKPKANKLSLWGHRLGKKILKNRISEVCLYKLALLSGFQFLHIGTPSCNKVKEKNNLIEQLRKWNKKFVPILSGVTKYNLDCIIENINPPCVLLYGGNPDTNKYLDFKDFSILSRSIF